MGPITAFPASVRSVYLMGICGTGMGSLAGLLRAAGLTVRGSDAHAYPPMSTRLAAWGIPVDVGYPPAALTPAPDLVVCGNVIRADNPQAVAARAQRLPTVSMPQAVARFGIGDRHSIVVAGTHGKTTTTALIAHLLEAAGTDPSYLIGGAPQGSGEPFRLGAGPHFVVEGDEYDTAYFDKGPKFVHYRARTAVLTSLEFDHADIFAGLAEVEAAFARLVAAVPEDGHLVVWQGAARARALIARHGRARRVTRYCAGAAAPADAELALAALATGPEGLTLEPVLAGRSLGPMRVPLWGRAAAANALAAVAVGTAAGLGPAELRAGLASFAGMRRRLEVVGDADGVTVVEDFAHHPTAVAATLEAAAGRFPGRPLWAAFEPRSATSRRRLFEDAYAEAFAPAAHVRVASHPRLVEVAAADRFEPARLAAALARRGVDAAACPDPAAIAADVAAHARPGDVVLCLSNGDFGGLAQALLEALRARVPVR